MTAPIEVYLRLGMFAGVFLAMSLWELCAPRRALSLQRGGRWLSNLGLVVLNTLAARFLMPITAVATAEIARQKQWGALNLVEWPYWLEFLLALVVLDLVIYLQHVLFHFVPILWRLHLVHHADLDFDVTTGLRFHTIEILLSAGLKVAAVYALGADPLAVVAFEVILNATAMFNHSNVRLPQSADRLLRWFVVTPDMHRVHHSVHRSETNSNFGFNVPWWDYWFGTYRQAPAAGHEHMTIGLTELRDESRVERLPGMLRLPFSDLSAPTERETRPAQSTTVDSGVDSASNHTRS